MEINRSIEREKVNMIISDYKRNNMEEILKLNNLLIELQDNFVLGQELLNKRYNYFCGEIIEKIKNNYPETFFLSNTSIDNLVKLLSDNSQNYNMKSLHLAQLTQCKNYSQPKFQEVYSNLKQSFDSIKKREKEMFSKCVVLEYDQISIEKCLYKEFKQFKNKMIVDLKEYYDQLNKFKKIIYI
jgi:hypothetical protein